MTLALCISDDGGRLFNNRRQSRDSVLIENLLVYAGGEKIFTSPYSAKLFPEGKAEITDGGFEGIDGIYFDETTPLAGKLGSVDRIILYRWNRDYPADIKLDIDIEAEFELTESTEFAGKSHEKITRDIYVKRDMRN